MSTGGEQERRHVNSGEKYRLCIRNENSARAGQLASGPSSISDPEGTSTTTWLHRWAMYSRMCSGPTWSGEPWNCASYMPMLSEHGCERLSHDQPIVFSRP